MQNNLFKTYLIVILVTCSSTFIEAQEKAIYSSLKTQWQITEKLISFSDIPYLLGDYYCVGARKRKSLTGKGGNYIKYLDDNLSEVREDILDLDSRWSHQLKVLDSVYKKILIKASKKVNQMSWMRSKSSGSIYYLCSWFESEHDIEEMILNL